MNTYNEKTPLWKKILRTLAVLGILIIIGYCNDRAEKEMKKYNFDDPPYEDYSWSEYMESRF